MSKKAEQKKIKFNETITVMFQNEKFGEGSYLSKQVDDEILEALSKLKVGDTLLLKNSGKTTSKGNGYGFLEILPPREQKDSDF